MKPTIIHFDGVTGEETVREMTDSEYAQHLIDVEENKIMSAEQAAKYAAEKAELDAAKAAVETKLAELGLDMDTIKAIAKLG
jgi:hypothetical protein